MAHKLISLSLYPPEITLLDELVEEAKKKSFTPQKVNRSTVIRDLLLSLARDNQKAKEVAHERS